MIGVATAAPISDLVTTLPGYSSTWPFDLYSGVLTVQGPVAGYGELNIRYEFHTSQGDPATDPLVSWHSGGPGAGSVIGAYTEMGYFQLTKNATIFTNEYAWNRVANVLYLDSPAGSLSGFAPMMIFGSCKDTAMRTVNCTWDDRSQAEAYAHTLRAFFAAFPEFANHDYYMTGESYFGPSQFRATLPSYGPDAHCR